VAVALGLAFVWSSLGLFGLWLAFERRPQGPLGPATDDETPDTFPWGATARLFALACVLGPALLFWAFSQKRD
jgi:hypothetical protein